MDKKWKHSVLQPCSSRKKSQETKERTLRELIDLSLKQIKSVKKSLKQILNSIQAENIPKEKETNQTHFSYQYSSRSFDIRLYKYDDDYIRGDDNYICGDVKDPSPKKLKPINERPEVFSLNIREHPRKGVSFTSK
ncbi:unnamed protein product, partial [Thlaspi arvense]